MKATMLSLQVVQLSVYHEFSTSYLFHIYTSTTCLLKICQDIDDG